jgi:hypothetical protein
MIRQLRIIQRSLDNVRICADFIKKSGDAIPTIVAIVLNPDELTNSIEKLNILNDLDFGIADSTKAA